MVAWCTTRRIKVGVPNGSSDECMFGYSEESEVDGKSPVGFGDDLKHYLRCRNLPFALGQHWPKSKVNLLHAIAAGKEDHYKVVALCSC